MGCDISERLALELPSDFNPRTHVGCDLDNLIFSFSFPFQSTHPCGVRLSDTDGKFLYGVISIHAPMWGATSYRVQGFGRFRISIHAPMWGATFHALILFFFIQISIHAPMWGATLIIVFLHKLLKISIHAPMWGATCNTKN